MISYNRILGGLKYLFPCSPFSLFRSLCYTFKYAKSGQVACGRKVKIYVKKNGKCEFHGNTDIGLKPTRIGYTGHPSFDYTIIQNNGGTLISDDLLHLKSGCRIVVGEDAILKLGKNVLIEYDTMVLTREKIEIGDDTWISWRCNIMDTDFHRIIINKEEKPSTQPIRIGKNCWIASCVTILKGVTIGDNCIIGANSVVTGDIPPNSLAVGNPCKVIKTEVNWEK